MGKLYILELTDDAKDLFIDQDSGESYTKKVTISCEKCHACAEDSPSKVTIAFIKKIAECPEELKTALVDGLYNKKDIIHLSKFVGNFAQE